MSKRQLPPNASVATEGSDGRLIAPAAARNTRALLDLLLTWAPASGRALEIASGTGQHTAAFAEAHSEVSWQPTEIDPARRASIDAYSETLPNVSAAIDLNATAAGWHNRFPELDLIVLINLVHLISWSETRILVSEVSKALAPTGRFVLYGPFKRSGCLTSDGDKRFHDALVQQDAEIGYKDDQDVTDLMTTCGLNLISSVEMPANNLAFVAEKPDT